MSNIDISVIIPMYQSEASIGRCLDCILKESKASLEIICVDDGSTDGTVAIVRGYAERDSRVKLITQSNQYAGVARNNGLAHAAGEYVTFIDADDLPTEGALAMMLRRARAARADMLKAGFIIHNTATGERYRTLYSECSAVEGLRRLGTTSLSKLPHRLLNIGDMPWNGIYLRSFLMENNIRFNSLCCVNDHSFYIGCLLHARRIKIIGNPVVIYHTEQSSSLVGRKAKNFGAQIESYRIVKEMLTDTDSRIRRIVLSWELNNLLSRYAAYHAEGSLSAEAEAEMTDFIKNYDEEDVGREFLESFAECGTYYSIRYNTEAPKRPGALVRAIHCYREHGLRYTIERLFAKGKRS